MIEASTTTIKKFPRLAYLLSLAVAILARLVVLFIPGNSVRTPWSSGSDAAAYVLLARNLVSGDGYTYAHMPSAFRMPGYPLILAGTMELFGNHFAFAARLLLGIAGFATAYFCMRAAESLFGDTAGKIALVAALVFPTLLYFSGEFLTEGPTSFFTALFFWGFAEDIRRPSWKTATLMGCAVGFGSLFRLNSALLGVVALAGAWIARTSTEARKQLVIIPLCAGLIVTPWIVRNWAAFGRPLLSTESGSAALFSVADPTSRLTPGWDDRLRAAVGHVLPDDLETNDSSRLAIGPEPDINRRCWQATLQLWRSMGWQNLASWTIVKWETFWLGTDQLWNARSRSPLNYALHVAGAVLYWILLALALRGWWNLRKKLPRTAMIFLGYAILITLIHTPFVMDTRIRAPLIDPLIAILAGGAL